MNAYKIQYENDKKMLYKMSLRAFFYIKKKYIYIKKSIVAWTKKILIMSRPLGRIFSFTDQNKKSMWKFDMRNIISLWSFYILCEIIFLSVGGMLLNWNNDRMFDFFFIFDDQFSHDEDLFWRFMKLMTYLLYEF